MQLPEPNTILVVDDEESLRFFLGEELEDQGYQVYTAADGQEALKLLQEIAVDLAIIDLQMPRVNGLELMAALQDLVDPPELIVLTAYATLDTSIAAMRYGGSDFLLKPYDVDQLLQSVRRVLARRRQKLQQKLAARLLADSLGLGGISPTRPSLRDRAGEEQAALGEPAPAGAVKPPDPAAPAVLKARGIVLDMETMQALKEGEILSLTPIEFRLLGMLMKHPNHPYTFQELARITHNQQIDDMEARDLLKSHMGRLRQKLGQAPDGDVYIANVRGIGYKFIGK